jgi:hypothetical protein
MSTTEQQLARFHEQLTAITPGLLSVAARIVDVVQDLRSGKDPSAVARIFVDEVTNLVAQMAESGMLD